MPIKTWSRLQGAVALSSAEAEFYAASQGTADVLHIVEIMKSSVLMHSLG